MRTWRGSARLTFVSALLGILAATSTSKAQLLVAATPGDPPAIEHAELAYALGAGPAVTWLSLRIQRGPVAVVAALPEGAAVGDALDAWFSALDSSAGPSVVAPVGVPACGRGGNLVRVAWPRARGLPAAELSLDSAADVTAALSAEGLTLESALPDAARFVVWSWSAVDSVQTTRTLRVEGGAAPLPLLPGFAFPVSLSVITTGPMAYEREQDKQLLEVTFQGGEPPSSDYVERLRDFVAGPAPLLETRARSLLFDWSLYSDVVSVAPLVQSYASHAQRELSDLDVDGCTEQLRALRGADSAFAGACGNAVDASLALAAADPELATLQRLALSSRDGVTPDQLSGGGEPSPPLLRARLFDDSACGTEPLPPIVGDPRPGPGTGALPPGTSGEEVVVEETVVVEHEHVEVDCGGSPEPASDDDYYEDDDVDCSSDTSGSSDATDDDVTCAGDSSTSTSSDEEVDCSSDSSSSSSTTSDDGCSSDTSSETGGYDGDTCTGSAAPRTDPPARQAQKRPQRLKTSLWTLAFAAMVLPIRRRKRAPSAGG